MMDKDLRPEEGYGFAREMESEPAPRPARARFVRSMEDNTTEASAPSAQRQLPEPVKVLPAPKRDLAPRHDQAPKPDNYGWVVRPKTPSSVVADASMKRPKVRDARGVAYATGGSVVSTAEGDGEPRSRSWLAVGLVGMVYVIGATGLWSMVQAFEENVVPTTVTPAGDKAIMPPLDDTIDVRDARLDPSFVPSFRPLAPSDTDSDVAASDLQEQI